MGAPATNWTWEELDPEGSRDPVERARDEQAALEAAIRDAYQRGVQDGTVQGARQADQHLRSTHMTLNGLLRQFGALRESWSEAMVDSMAAISVTIARQILDRELTTSPDTIQELIKAALDRFPVDHAIRIRVNAKDLEALRACGADEDITGNRWAQWVAEESVDKGSFVVEGPERIVDGRIDHSLEKIYRSMTDV